MIGIVVLVCAILLIRQKFFGASNEVLLPVEPTPTIPLAPIDPVELQADWRQGIASILADYDKTGDARAAKERMLTVRVPGASRDVHLALFLAFNALGDSRPEGKAKLAAARAEFEKPAATPVTASSTVVTSSTTR